MASTKTPIDALEDYKNTGNFDVSGTLTAAGSTLSATEMGYLDGAVAGTNTASKALVVDGSKAVDVLTTTGLLTAASSTVTGAFTSSGTMMNSFAAITAGTTQTQAGATAITTDIVQVTTGNASDGLRLPALTTAMIGRTIRIINASANAGVLYGTGTTSTNTINGTAGATGVAYAASKMLTVVAVSATAWVTTLSN